jgi:hypothetical protein
MRRIEEDAAETMAGKTGLEPGVHEANRRGAPREPARDLCEILTYGTGYALPCMAHNISATGALLETGMSGLPDRFVLVNHTRRTRTVCHVRWRCGRMAGVHFARPPRSFD